MIILDKLFDFREILVVSITIFNIILGGFVLARSKKDSISVVYLAAITCITMWCLSMAVYRISNTTMLGVLACRALYASASLIPGTFVLFTYIFPTGKINSKEMQIALVSISNIFMIILSLFTPSIINTVIINQNVEHVIVFGDLYFLYILYIAGFFTWAFINLAIKHRNYKGVIKQQVGYIFVGSFLTAAISCVTNLFMPTFGNFILNWMGQASTIFYVIGTSAADIKSRLMDISVIISKSFAYAVTMVVLGIGYLLFVIPYRFFVSPNINIGFISLSIVYGIFTGFSFERLRMFIQTSSDKLFLKGRYDFKGTMSYFVEKLFRIVSMDDLNVLFEKARIEIIESKILKIIALHSSHGISELPNEIINLLSSSKEIEFMSDIKHKLKEMSGVEDSKDIEFFVPCFSGETLIAVLIVGKKLSDDPFKDDEIDVFRILAPQIATVIERIRPYETAQKDLAVEKERALAAQKAAEENARLATLGTLAAGLAHEIRNPMTVIRSRAERGISHLEDGEFNKESNALTIKHIDRILDIVNRMLKFARNKEGSLRQANISMILDEVVSMAENKIKDKNIKIEKDFGHVPMINCDPDPILEALLNICINSVEAIDKEGRISVKCSVSHMSNVNGDDLPAVLIEIEDNGKGISEEDLPRIFDPFFTKRHEGTGLGLSIAHRIIAEEHRGIITVKSSQGKGTKFSVYLPIKI